MFIALSLTKNAHKNSVALNFIEWLLKNLDRKIVIVLLFYVHILGCLTIQASITKVL